MVEVTFIGAVFYAAAMTFVIAAAWRRAARQVVVATFVTLVVCLLAVAAIEVQMEWRTRQKTIMAITAVGLPAAALALVNLFAIARASWPRGLKVPTTAAFMALLVGLSAFMATGADPGWRDRTAAFSDAGFTLLTATALILALLLLATYTSPATPKGREGG